MSWFADLPVQRKLGYAILLTTASVLLVACGVFLAVEYGGYKRQLASSVGTLTRITADNNTAVLAFRDRTTARDNLESLRGEPQILSATLFDDQGEVFAWYAATGSAAPQRASASIGTTIKQGTITVVQPVLEGTRRLGTLQVEASLARIYQQMLSYAGVVVVIFALSVLLAWAIAGLLRQTLSEPILELVRTAEAISQGEDYTRRARQFGHDELGMLTATFNGMLQKIQTTVGALQESEWGYRQLVHGLPVAAYMCDREGRITIFNEAAASLWGRSPQLGSDSWCGSYRMYLADGTPLALEDGPMAVALREGRAVRGQEIIIERPDGSRRNVIPHPEPIRDTAGNLVGVVNMLLDVTEEKRITATARQLAAIVESSNDAIIGKDLDGVITSWNRGAQGLFGYTEAEVLGRPVTILIPPDRIHEEVRILASVRQGVQVEHFETVRRRSDGTLIHVSLVVSPIRDSHGKIIGASKIVRDITARKQAEDVLRDTRARLEATLVAAEIGTWNWDLATNLVTPDRNLARMFGLDPDTTAAPYEDYIRIIHPDDRERVSAEISAALHGGEFESDYRLVGRDGNVRWFTARGRPQRNAAGAVTTFPGVLIDITARKRAEAAGEGQRRVLQLIAEDAPLKDILDELMRTVERAASTKVYGSVLLLQGTQLTSGGAPSLPGPFTAAFEGLEIGPEVGACGTAAWSKRPVFVADIATSPLWSQFKDLALAHGLRACWSTPIISRQETVMGTFSLYYPEPREPDHDDLNLVDLATGTAAIAIENKRAAAVLREREAQLRLVTDNAPVFLLRVDRQHRFTFANRAYAQRYGFEPDNLVGRPVVEVVGRRAYDSISACIDEALTGERVELELEIPYETLGPRWVHFVLVPEIENSGLVTGLLGVLSDIDARKQAENELKRARDEAIAASRAKDDFLAALSHELRTPLNPVLLLASAAASNTTLPAEVRSDFEVIRKNVDLEARLIDDLLDLTRITRGKLRLDRLPHDIHAILQDAIANVQLDVDEKLLELSLSVTPGENFVVGDAVRLQQVFWNILKNAVKFTPAGGRIRVSTSRLPDPTRFAVTITDTGIGMTAEELPRIFQAFAQGDHAASASGQHRFGGLGLGLTISRMLVELHGGKIVAHSGGRNEGSTFTVDLPLDLATNPVAPAISTPANRTALPPAPSNRVEARPNRILLVEDHAATRATMVHLLRQRRFEVFPADSAAKAAGLAALQKFDLVICDIGLPDRNGYELMAELRALDPQLVGIALSGYGMEEDRAKSLAAGFALHLVKPVNIGALEEAIAALAAAPRDEAPA